MSLITEIADMMLRQGDIEGQRRREELAMLNEKQEQKWYNRPLRNTLKGIATVAPLFMPGGEFASVFGDKWAQMGMSPWEKYLIMNMGGGNNGGFLDPSQNPDVLVQRRGY